MRKWTSLLFAVAVMLFLTAHIASAQTVTPQLVLDGKILTPAEPPALIGNFTMVPVRVVGENLGYKVDFDNSTKQVTVANGNSVVQMVLNQTVATINGKSVSLQAAPTAKSGSTLVPLRFLGEAFGLQVYWENVQKSVYLYSATEPSSPGGSSGGATDPGTTTPGTPSPGSGNSNGSTDAGNPDNGSEGDTDDGSVITVPEGTVALVHSVAFENDTITLKYDTGFLLPKAQVLTGPDRIVIDLPSAAFASDFAPALKTDANGNTLQQGELPVTDHAVLQKIRYSLFADKPSTLRFVLDLNKAWGYTIANDALSNTLQIKLQDPSTIVTPTTPGKGVYTVVLDAGHGGSDPGAPSITGKWEKNFTLAVILKLQALLASDSRLNVVLTRSSDTYPSLADRYNLANSLGADLFLSVHGNSNPKSTVKGTEVYYTRAESLAFANVVRQYATPSTGLVDRGVIQKSLAVTRETKMPAVLYEAGYLSNVDDEKAMYTEDFQNKLAQGLATAIKVYLQLS